MATWTWYWRRAATGPWSIASSSTTARAASEQAGLWVKSRTAATPLPLADLDGDGDLDFIVSNDRPDLSVAYLNDGAGRFEPGGPFGEAKWPTRNGLLADLDGDGRADAALANRGPTPNQVCLNGGTGRTWTCKPLGPESSSTILAADLDGDGDQDLLAPHRDGGASRIYLNDGRGSFPESKPFGPQTAATRAATIADFDRDGMLDVAAAHEGLGRLPVSQCRRSDVWQRCGDRRPRRSFPTRWLRATSTVTAPRRSCWA